METKRNPGTEFEGKELVLDQNKRNRILNDLNLRMQGKNSKLIQ